MTAQDAAEACIRPMITVDGIIILPKWPGYARRIVAALEGVDRLSWGELRDAFGEGYDGSLGGDVVVRHLVDGGVVERVFWDVATGEEVAGPTLEDFFAGPHSDDAAERERWKAWGKKHGMGYRLRRETLGARGAERG